MTIGGEPWFSGADVLHVLYGRSGGIAHVYKAVGEEEKRKVKRVHLGMTPGRDTMLLSESGLYKLVLRSDKPEAKPFQDWVTKEVLPAIRKDGA
ncbi:MAG: Bro-N domain-containing protein [Allorhizobium sp.]